MGDPFKEPFRVLPGLMRVEPLNHVWPYLMGQACREVGRTEEAEADLVKALKLNPLDSGTWSSLADLYLDEARKGEAFLALNNAAFLEPSDASVQWGVLVRLMALDLSSVRPVVERVISRLLLVDPPNRRNLFALARLVTREGRMDEWLPRDEGLWRSYLLWLISQGRLDEAMDVWDEMGDWGWRDRALFRRVVGGLLAKGGVSQARRVWQEEFPGDPVVHNGGFEKNILGFGFGWRFNPRIPGLKSWGYTTTERIEGRRSFFMVFDGENNPGVAWPRQLVYLGVPGNYRLSAYVKTEGVTGATGFALMVWGKGVRARSRELKGYTPWRWIHVLFTVHEPGAFWVAVVRPSTRKLNRFLGGRVWIDQVVLERMNGDEEGAAQGSPG